MTMDDINAEIKAVRDAKSFLDTNIIVSALISNSIPSKILYELVLPSKVKKLVCLTKFSQNMAVMNRENLPDMASLRQMPILY